MDPSEWAFPPARLGNLSLVGLQVFNVIKAFSPETKSFEE